MLGMGHAKGPPPLVNVFMSRKICGDARGAAHERWNGDVIYGAMQQASGVCGYGNRAVEAGLGWKVRSFVSTTECGMTSDNEYVRSWNTVFVSGGLQPFVLVSGCPALAPFRSVSTECLCNKHFAFISPLLRWVMRALL